MFDDARDVIESLRLARPHSNKVLQQRCGVVEPLLPLEALAVACRWLGRKFLVEATEKKLQVPHETFAISNDPSHDGGLAILGRRQWQIENKHQALAAQAQR